MTTVFQIYVCGSRTLTDEEFHKLQTAMEQELRGTQL